ncbi:hypothetical protein SEVIR_1G074801v4 [Setaria viridis]|uniref:Uncharacterized protein n=1 Tax=Setaria viridis TaxID=4556 RepID=A0A4U6W5K2_SETVI|nr:hypothetical protein SEVIR_1G074801v2 [Setaria viridis]
MPLAEALLLATCLQQDASRKLPPLTVPRGIGILFLGPSPDRRYKRRGEAHGPFRKLRPRPGLSCRDGPAPPAPPRPPPDRRRLHLHHGAHVGEPAATGVVLLLLHVGPGVGRARRAPAACGPRRRRVSELADRRLPAHSLTHYR